MVNIMGVMDEARRQGYSQAGWFSPDFYLPLPGRSVLCVGDSYDAWYDHGYLIARVAVITADVLTPSAYMCWIMGKQELEPDHVAYWRWLPNLPDGVTPDTLRWGRK